MQDFRWTRTGRDAVLAGTAMAVLGLGLSSPHLLLGAAAAFVLPIADGLLHLRRPFSAGLEVTPDRVAEGEPLSVSVEAPPLRAGQSLHVPLPPSVGLDGEASNVFTPDAPRTAFVARAGARGPQEIGPATLRQWSPLHMWVSEQEVTKSVAVDVVPRSEDTSEIGLLSRILKPMQGRFTVNRPGQGFDFFTLRGYASGDTIRSVNWKASARTDDLIVNQRQVETFSSLTVFLDHRVVTGTGPLGRTALDRSCRAALGIIQEAHSARDTFRLFAYGATTTRFDPTGRDRIRAVEDLLARLPPEGSTPIATAWDAARGHIKGRGPIIVITPAEADPTLPTVVRDMVGHGHPVTVVSPEPLGTSWEGAAQHDRRQRRQAALESLQGTGAVVVDWGPGVTVRSEAPEVLAA